MLNSTQEDLPIYSSPIFQFWDGNSDAYQIIWKQSAYTSLKSILGFIFWEFSPNNNGNPVVAGTESYNQAPNLPAEYHATASVGSPFQRFVIDQAAFISYVALQSSALIFCWSVLLWQQLTKRELPTFSPFPAVDFGTKLRRTRNHKERLFGNVAVTDDAKEIKAILRGIKVSSHQRDQKEDLKITSNLGTHMPALRRAMSSKL
jgi:hypothetical protein